MPKKLSTEELLKRAKKNEERAKAAREEYDRRVSEENRILVETVLSSYETLIGETDKEVITKRLPGDLRKAPSKSGDAIAGQMELSDFTGP